MKTDSSANEETPSTAIVSPLKEVTYLTSPVPFHSRETHVANKRLQEILHSNSSEHAIAQASRNSGVLSLENKFKGHYAVVDDLDGKILLSVFIAKNGVIVHVNGDEVMFSVVFAFQV